MQMIENCERDGDTLTFEIKSDNQNDPPIFAVLATLFCFMAFLSCFRGGETHSLVAMIFFALIIFGLYYCIRTTFRVRILRLDASTLRIESHYRSLSPAVKFFLLDMDTENPEPQKSNESSEENLPRKMFLSFKKGFSTFVNKYRPDHWHSTETFDRKTLLAPVSRVVYLTRIFDTTSFSFKKVYRYETRFLFGDSRFREYRHQLVIQHETPEKMRKFEGIVRHFIDEVPYKESRAESVETVNEKAYAVLKNEGLTSHGDEFHGESFRERRKTYRVTHTENQSDEKTELLIVVERGAGISSVIGRCSQFLYSMAMLILLAALIALYVLTWAYWESAEKDVLNYVQGSAVRSIIPPEMNAGIQNAIRSFPDREPLERKLWALAGVSLLVLPLIFILYLVFYYILRWPFWIKWTLRVEKRKGREPTICCDWQTDRYHDRSLRSDARPFFKVIPATNRTNFTLTGRTYVDFNPAWRLPLQVVALTATRSFVIPVNDEEEQQDIIRVLLDFEESD